MIVPGSMKADYSGMAPFRTILEHRAPQVGVEERGVRQIGACQVCELKIRPSQIGSPQVGISQISPLQVCIPEIGSIQRCFRQPGPLKACSAQVGSAQVRKSQVGPVELGPFQVRAAEVEKHEISLAEVNAGKVRLLQRIQVDANQFFVGKGAHDDDGHNRCILRSSRSLRFNQKTALAQIPAPDPGKSYCAA
jgi:hypothetical protein